MAEEKTVYVLFANWTERTAYLGTGIESVHLTEDGAFKALQAFKDVYHNIHIRIVEVTMKD